jgi:uncharacterized damage-inducible protein DinB
MLNRDALDDLYEYTDWTWKVFAKKIQSLPADTLTKPAPGSGWPALRDCYYHFVGTYDFFLHNVLHLGELIRPPKESIATWRDMEAYRHSTRATLRNALDDMPDGELYEVKTRIIAEQLGGEKLSAADIFANLLVHERGHHGDISTLLYQLGHEPPVVDYRPFAVARHRAETD